VPFLNFLPLFFFFEFYLTFTLLPFFEASYRVFVEIGQFSVPLVAQFTTFHVSGNKAGPAQSLA